LDHRDRALDRVDAREPPDRREARGPGSGAQAGRGLRLRRMPRFCANISMLFTERAFPERFEAAARAGFRAVEIQFPYRWGASDLAARARAAGVEIVQINLPAGDAERSDRG